MQRNLVKAYLSCPSQLHGSALEAAEPSIYQYLVADSSSIRRLALKPIILCTIRRCFAAFWTCLFSVFKYWCFAILQLVYLNHGWENVAASSAFDNHSHTLFIVIPPQSRWNPEQFQFLLEMNLNTKFASLSSIVFFIALSSVLEFNSLDNNSSG